MGRDWGELCLFRVDGVYLDRVRVGGMMGGGVKW